jgi:hypothetical protein
VSLHRPAVRPVRTDPSTSSPGKGVNAGAMLAELVEVVIGVDTHTAAVVTAVSGAVAIGTPQPVGHPRRG